MRTAEEWQKEWYLRCSRMSAPALHNEDYYHQEAIKLNKEIQLDAFKAGMSRAADDIFKYGQMFSGKEQEKYHALSQALLTTRDNIKIEEI